MKKIIEIKNLNFSYEEGEVIDDISLNLEGGKFISILGPNGSGKSTLVKLILGLLKGEGEIILEGKNLKDITRKERARILSYVPQWNELSYEYSIEEMVSMGRHPYIGKFSSPSKEDKDKVDEALKAVGLYNKKDKLVTRLSGGEKQRVSLARALCQDTPIIILDEPVNHLDIRFQIEILEILKTRIPEKTVIAVMHDINLASRYSDDILLMKEGRVEIMGRTKDILTEKNLYHIYDVFFTRIDLEDYPLFIEGSVRKDKSDNLDKEITDN